MADPTPYKTDQDFFFKTPLYEKRALNVAQVKHLMAGNMKFDGYCAYCRKETTFERDSTGNLLTGYSEANYMAMHRFSQIDFNCARSDSHSIPFYIYFAAGSIQKVGQFPSFADIAIDESKNYSKLLDKEDVSEFHKAIGLAAHGVGIGSYVYLRRIFERLIWKRFAEFKESEGWDETAFKAMRMKEKIEHLKGHLPEFLVSNAKLYSILSLGVHELKEADCLAFFPVLRQSTIWILEQDKKKQEELAQRKELEASIAKFSPHSTATET
jgi:hypothetical protein